jgi:hypothetical protein
MMSVSADAEDHPLTRDVDHLASLGANAFLTSETASQAYREEQVQRYIRIVLKDFDCDLQRLTAAIEGCRRKDSKLAAEGFPDNWYVSGVALADPAVDLLRERGAHVSGLARDALRDEVYESSSPIPKPSLQAPEDPHWLPRRLDPERRAHRQSVNARAWLEHHGTDEACGLQRITIHLDSRSTTPACDKVVGRMEYRVCHICRLGQITDIEVHHELRDLGLGSRAIEYARDQVPGYRWTTSRQLESATSYWKLMARRTGAEFTGPGVGVPTRCEHMRESDRPDH